VFPLFPVVRSFETLSKPRPNRFLFILPRLYLEMYWNRTPCENEPIVVACNPVY
jgi:hypothetical protein